MQQTSKAFVDGVTIPGTTTTLYTVPANTTAIIKEMLAYNSHTGALTFNLYFVPSGGSAAPTTNQVYGAYAIAAGQTIPKGFNTVLGAGGTIQADASTASKIALRISGYEQVGT